MNPGAHNIAELHPGLLQQAFGDANASLFPGELPAPAPLRIGNDFEAVRKVLESEAGFGR